MTKISRIKVDPKHLGLFINNFWSLVTLLENKDQVRGFLKDLLTHTEMKMFAKRIQIAKMLLEGYDYQNIRSHVKVSDPTIAKISNLLSISGEGLRTAINYLQKIEADIEKEKMRITPNLKKQYGIYFLPEKLIDATNKKLKSQNKKHSAKRSIEL